MAKKRHADADDRRDPLGKPLAAYSSRGKAFMVIATALVLALSGGCVHGSSRRLAERLADSHEDGPYRFLGWTLMIVGSAAVAYGTFHLGKRFELRRKGLRFVSWGGTSEIRWDDVMKVDFRRTIHYHNGSKVREDWEVDIFGTTADIHLGKEFLRMVPSIVGLVTLLRGCTGKEIELPPM